MEGIAKTKIQLERSRDVSLMVNMSIWPLSSEDDMEEKLSRFITLLEPERHRIRRLVIEPFRRTWMISATAFIREATFQRLEALHLGYAEEDGTHDLEELTIQGPIRELRLRRTPVLNGSIGLALPQLERLSLEELNITANSMQDALLTMTGLRSLTMIDVQFSDTDPVSFNQIPLPHLRYLSVRRSATQVVIPHLETPSLITLYIDNLCLNGVLDPAEGVEAAILVAIARSNSQLRQLHAEDCYMAPDAWTEVFRSLPELEYLHIRGCGVDKTHLSALAWLRTETRGSDEIPATRLFACPNLEEIVFENELSLTSDVVREIVEARASVTGSRGVGSISWITFWGCDSDLITDEDVHVIAGLTRGISCDLVDGNDIWEDSEDSYVESGDDWKCSDWELEDSSSEASDE